MTLNATVYSIKTKLEPKLCMLQGETQDCEMSLLLPCPKTCKNLWRSCVDHHCFFSSNRSPRSSRLKNTTLQSYRKLITQHLGLGNSKPERWGLGHPCNTYSQEGKEILSWFVISVFDCSGPVCQRVVGGMVWNPVLRRSLSSEHLETKSLPSRSPPSTPNWYSHQH